MCGFHLVVTKRWRDGPSFQDSCWSLPYKKPLRLTLGLSIKKGIDGNLFLIDMQIDFWCAYFSFSSPISFFFLKPIEWTAPVENVIDKVVGWKHLRFESSVNECFPHSRDGTNNFCFLFRVGRSTRGVSESPEAQPWCYFQSCQSMRFKSNRIIIFFFPLQNLKWYLWNHFFYFFLLKVVVWHSLASSRDSPNVWFSLLLLWLLLFLFIFLRSF